MFDLSGQVAVVTGASSGLGHHFAKLLARHGAAVALAARRVDRLDALVKEIAATDAIARGYAMDVTDGASIAAAIDKIGAELGPPQILINNAGISIVKPALSMGAEDWDQVMDTDLRGAFLVAQAVARALVAAKKPGRIVNIASITGIRTIGQIAPYGAAKAGLIHLTKTLAMEWARHGIAVNALAPGYIATELNADFWQTDAGKRLIERVPQRRLGQPEELDGPLMLLASQASSFMTGAIIVIDGGHSINSL